MSVSEHLPLSADLLLSSPASGLLHMMCLAGVRPRANHQGSLDRHTAHALTHFTLPGLGEVPLWEIL